MLTYKNNDPYRFGCNTGDKAAIRGCTAVVRPSVDAQRSLPWGSVRTYSPTVHADGL